MTWEQLGILRRQAENCLKEMAEAVASGRIEANPIWQSESENACRTCPYERICRFEEGEKGESSRAVRNLPDAEVWELLGEQQREEDVP